MWKKYVVAVLIMYFSDLIRGGGVVCVCVVCVFYLHFYLYTMCVPSVHRAQKRPSDSLELEL